MLKKIKIKGLFNKFDYDIELKKEGLTILTGPNGYGKTTILKIIYALAVKNIFFFFQLPFNKIELIQEKEQITIVKKGKQSLDQSELKSKPFKDIIIEIQQGNKKPTSYNRKDIIRLLRKESLLIPIDKNRWISRRTDEFYTTEQVINELLENDNKLFQKYYKSLPEFIDVYFIKEQRLIKKKTLSKRRRFSFEDEIENSFIDTIQEYAVELSENIRNIMAEYSRIAQGLDSSFPKRLFNQSKDITEKSFNKRYEQIKKKQELLSLFGLPASKDESHTSYKKENAKALLVYLEDTKEKLAVFDEIFKKLKTFSTILNERKFVFKNFEFSSDFGFRFISEDGKEIPLTNLSSGEQQEVVLLYELLFKVKPNTLLLIDEPEMSLHVVWQKEVINDLLKIIELQKINVILATHSPQIIDEHWALSIDLFDLSKKEIFK
ncbi:MAG: AAA family ATPase [Deltaproteobacteria bacterium]|nr:AAA family ATPase [Deltaproteobacteria bacterium]